ncbi:unnamed protein product [Anisakis simplex]|uniref:Sodium-dependent multivitamin transporter n=1 Tax=Anisakis simplex TaxID=6269 RepID=A0A0M3K2E5_ANISI|nr:unnamed protein product [Anisakis simplex]
MLGFVDIVVFTGFMLLSVFVGVYHGYKSSRISSTQDDGVAEFLLGNRKLPIVPVCLSLLTTFVSGIALLGQPAEVYHRGLMFIFPSITGSVAIIFSAIFFLPIFYKLKMTSVYEYFEIRFDSKLLRRIGSLLFLFNTLAYMAVVMYAPAVALVQVTKSTLWPFILVCDIYRMIVQICSFDCLIYSIIEEVTCDNMRL